MPFHCTVVNRAEEQRDRGSFTCEKRSRTRSSFWTLVTQSIPTRASTRISTRLTDPMILTCQETVIPRTDSWPMLQSGDMNPPVSHVIEPEGVGVVVDDARPVGDVLLEHVQERLGEPWTAERVLQLYRAVAVLPMMYMATAMELARVNISPMAPPNSGPRALNKAVMASSSPQTRPPPSSWVVIN